MRIDWSALTQLIVSAFFLCTGTIFGWTLEARYRRAFAKLHADRDALQASYEEGVKKAGEEARELVLRESHRLRMVVQEFINDPYAPKWADEKTVTELITPQLKVM